MTENETKEILAIHYEFLRESWKPYPDRKVLDALRIAISSIDKIQQYRAIGTVEECREAMEKQRGKKPVMKPFYKDMEEEYLCCPTCGDILTDRIPMDNKDFYFHCLNCGQKFDWTDTL